MEQKKFCRLGGSRCCVNDNDTMVVALVVSQVMSVVTLYVGCDSRRGY